MQFKNFIYTKVFDKFIFHKFKTLEDGKCVIATMYLVDPSSILYRTVMVNVNLPTLNFKDIIKH